MRSSVVWLVALGASVTASPALAPGAVHAAGAKRAHCPRGMVWVSGEHCPKVEQACVKWLPNPPNVPGDPLRCAEFAEPVCKAPTVATSFCIDRYEFPGKKGQRPRVDVRWTEAEQLCGKQGKRLCLEPEWTFACEGEAMLPYPYGLTRDADACHIDAPLPAPSRRATQGAHWRSPVDQREPSGKRKRCKSPFGVFDLTGNVDEWIDGRPSGHAASSMGGYWGPVRNRCRAVTRAHNESFAFYQTGFRCCKDAQ